MKNHIRTLLPKRNRFFKSNVPSLFAALLSLLFFASARAAETTVTFSSTESTAWSDGIAEDGDGGSVNIPNKTIRFYCISDVNGTLLNKPLVHGNSYAGDGFDALTTYDPTVNNTGFKGMEIDSQDGSEFQLNGFYYSNWGEFSSILITVKGYRNGVEVASTSFSTDVDSTGYQSKVVALDSSFDDVDAVRLYSSGTSWHGINNIKIDDAIIPNSPPSDISLSKTSVSQSAGVNAAVGTLSSTDANPGDAHVYTLVSGVGSTDNSSFNISAGTLRANNAAALAGGVYSVRIQTDDLHGGTFAKQFSITVVDDIAPVITSAGTASGVYGTPFTYTIVATGGATTYGASGLPSGLNVNSSTGDITGTPAQTGSFNIPITAADAAGNATTNTVSLTVAKAQGGIVLGGMSPIYDGTAKSVSVTTTPTGLSVALTYDNSATAPSDAGSYQVIASIVDGNYFGSVTDTLTIAKAPAVVVFSGLSQTYDGTEKNVSASTTPEGLALEVTYNGSTAVPSNAGDYEVIATVNDANYFGAATNTLMIAKAPATVMLSNLNQVYDGTGKSAGLSVTPSGLTVLVTYSGSTDVPTNAGDYEVIATVSDANHAGAQTNTLTIAKAPAAVALSNLSQVYDGAAKSVSATTAPDGLSVLLTYDGNSAAPINAGTYQVIGSVADANYAGAATNVLTITLPAPTIALNEETNWVTLGDHPAPLAAAAVFSAPGGRAFAGGGLSVTIVSNAGPDDLLWFYNPDSGTNRITVNGNDVLFDGASIATYSGGSTGLATLTFTFTANANEVSIQELLRNTAFGVMNCDATNLFRTVQFVATDGDGAQSDSVLLTVALNHRPQAQPDRIVTITNLPATISLERMLTNDFDIDGDSLTITNVENISEKGGAVTLGASGILYTPPIGFAGTDHVTYWLNDGHSGITSGTVQVIVLSGEAVAIENSPADVISLNHSAVVAVSGIPGDNYRLLASEDLLQWIQIGTVTPDENGIARFVDTDAVNHDYRFYRTVRP